jgi:antitoxin HicB
MIRYPVTLHPDDNDTVLVNFPDFPEAHTFGDTEDEARARAVDALETVIEAYIRDRRDIPAPSSGTATVTLPALMAAKVQLYTAMRRLKVNKAELARRLGVHMPQVDRLLDVKHGSKLDQLEAAARALGGELDVRVVVVTPATADHKSMEQGRYVSKTTAMRKAAEKRPRTIPNRPTVHPAVMAAQKSAGERWKSIRVGGKAPKKR